MKNESFIIKFNKRVTLNAKKILYMISNSNCG